MTDAEYRAEKAKLLASTRLARTIVLLGLGVTIIFSAISIALR